MLSLFGRTRFAPARLGPAWHQPAPDRIAVTSGPLAGREFGLRSEITPTKADFYVDADGELVAHTHFQRSPETGLETEWDIFVHADFRGKGLSSLIVRLSYRRLLALGGRRWVYMRKLMQVDSRRRELQNIGIGVIGVRIGMRPEPALEEILAGCNVKSVELVPGGETSPPGLFIQLRRLPGVVVAAELEIESGHPRVDIEHYRRLISTTELVRAARAGRAVIGNIDYVLPKAHIEQFARHFANDAAEFRAYVRALRAGARNSCN